MIQEDKKLLLKDLCARLLYGVECLADDVIVGKLVGIAPLAGERYLYLQGVLNPYRLDEVKPYLRSMDDMTKEERKEYEDIILCNIANCDSWHEVDWLNAHHFDFRNLIERGLAIEVTEENNPYENNN